MRHNLSTTVSRLLPYLAISATLITHLLGKQKVLSHIKNNHFDAKGGSACENAAKSPNTALSCVFSAQLSSRQRSD